MICIVLITVMLATEIFYLTLICSFIGCYFEFLPLSPLHVCSVSLKSFKEFRTLWPFPFTYLPVKGIYTFWKVQGIIGGFDESFRQIASGAKKRADESMSYI